MQSIRRTAAAAVVWSLLAVVLVGLGGTAFAADPPATTTTTKSSTSSTAVARVTKKKPCRVVTKSDVQRDLGAAATSSGNSITKFEAICRWSVAANGERPAGSLRVGISFGVPKGAYKALAKNPQYVVVDGLDANALYQPATGSLSIFKGTTIVTMRGTFVDTTVRPIRSYEPKAVLTTLAGSVVPKL